MVEAMFETKEKHNKEPLVSTCELIEQELKKIIDLYEMELRYVAYKYVRDWFLVDDIMQEVFIKIYMKLNSIEDRYKLKSWLYAITCNQCIDYLRSKAVSLTHLIGDPEEVNISNNISAEIETIQRLEKQLLYKAIASLPNEYKEPIILFHFKQFSYKEISEALNENLGVIKSRLFRGRQLLKETYLHYQVLELGYY